jgi:hypothetical protein
MAEDDEGRNGGHLSERVNVRFTKNEMAWLRDQATRMNPKESVAYMVRACVVGFRHITTQPLIETLKPLPEPLPGKLRPATTVHKPPQRSAK